MTEKKTSVFENSLIWFGAAVSLAEILTGTYFAPLGFGKGLAAILLGHGIGCTLLFLAGLIGGKTRKSAMETCAMCFGYKGSFFFAFLNILQLVGWTAIMIYDGAVAANGIFAAGQWVWAAAIGGLIVLWLLIGVKSLGKINTLAMAGLFILTVLLSLILFRERSAVAVFSEGLSFGAAVELSVAMPLSWLPLISDYTKDAEKPIHATAASVVTYGVVSCWMYVIGMGAAIFADTADISQIMLSAGLGTAGLCIIVLSTVTTTFLDAYSAGVSAEIFSRKVRGKWIAVCTTVLGTFGAIFYPLENITDFLYLIGSVFAPMLAIQIADFFILKKEPAEAGVNGTNICLWAMGFFLYRQLMQTDSLVGSTLPDMLATVALCILVHFVKTKSQKKRNC